MDYCSECGTEVKDMNFCPDCGADVSDEPDSMHNEATTNTNSDTAPCEKCNSQISTDALKCPQCGYEPSSSYLTGILGYLASLVLMFSVLILVITPILVVDGFPISDATIVFGFFGVLAVISGAIVWAWKNQDNRKPTDSSLTG